MSPKRKKGLGENKYAKFHLYITKTDAWKALPLRAKALYPLLMLQWAGDRYNNNGEIFLSLRQAAERLGCSKDTARQAFWDLQVKGFIQVRVPGYLGVSGVGKAKNLRSQNTRCQVQEQALSYF